MLRNSFTLAARRAWAEYTSRRRAVVADLVIIAVIAAWSLS
jgi:hypothetical protein